MTKEVVVVDPGSGKIKGGYAGEEEPRIVHASTIAPPYYVEMDSGPVIESMLTPLLLHEMSVDPEGTLLVLIVPTHCQKAIRSMIEEIVFEKLQISSLVLLSSPAASLYSSGLVTGLSLNCGHQYTSCTAVYEGMALPYASVFSRYSSLKLTDSFLSTLQILRPNNSLTFYDAQTIKESISFIKSKSRKGKENVFFELPDGEVMEANDEIINLPSANYFTNTPLNDLTMPNASNEEYKPEIYSHNLPLLINTCIHHLEGPLQSSFYPIYISGGGGSIPGMTEKLIEEMSCDKEMVLSNVHTKYAAFIGGSIIGSLSTIEALSTARSQGEEEGAGHRVVGVW